MAKGVFRRLKNRKSKTVIVKKVRAKSSRSKGLGNSGKSAMINGTVANHTMPRGIFPDNLWLKFRTVMAFNFANTGSYINQFRLNSCYDPDYTNLGSAAPRYYNTLLSADGAVGPYNRSLVHGYKMVFHINTTSAIPTALSFTVAGFNTSPPATLAEAYERADTKVMTMGALTGSDTKKKLVARGYIKAVLGNKDLSDNEEAWGRFNSNPSDNNTVLGTVRLWAVDASTTYTATVFCHLTQYTQLFYKNDVADS